MKDKDYYKILGVSENATEEQIKAEYRKMAMKYHPDRNPDNRKQAEEKFKEISEAYYTIGDPKRRKQYDDLRRMGAYSGDFSEAQGFDFEEFFSRFRKGPPQRGQASGSYSIFGDIFDIFSGAGMNFGNTQGNGYSYKVISNDDEGPFSGYSGQHHQKYDTDIHAVLRVPAELAKKGGNAEFKIGSNKGKISVKIPPGTKNRQKLRLKDQGNLCPGCEHKGDLILTIEIQ